MSWKAVELQVALPRTQDAGKLQEQLQQRGQAAQDRMADREAKELEKQRTQVTDKQETEKAKLSSREGEFPPQSLFSSPGAEQSENNHRNTHPYKGKSIDITG